MLFVERKLLPGFQLVCGGSLYRIVEAGNENASRRVFELRDDLRERDKGIGRSATIHAGMQVGFRASRLELGIDHATQAHAECGQLRREQFRVGNKREVGFEAISLLANKFRDLLAAYFFFAFENYPHVDRQLAAIRFEQRFQRLDMDIHLPLVVDGAAGVQVAVALRRLKRWRPPFIKGIGWLHIVMPVTEARGLARGVQPVAIDQRMAVCLDDLNVLKTDTLQLFCQPCGRAEYIGFVFGQRGDGRDAKEGL